jgi:hypothetical protein
MAGLVFDVSTATVALTAATLKTVVQIVAATNHKVRIVAWKATFDGASPTATPVAYRILRQTTAGTMSALTPVKAGSDAETILTTAQHTATAEPTASDVLEAGFIHPQVGQADTAPFAFENMIPGGGRVGWEFTAPAGVNVRVTVRCEE